MKKWLILSIYILNIYPIFAQNSVYSNQKEETKLVLTENNFFQFQNLKGLIKEYNRGEWSKNGNQIILKESAHSEKNSNQHSIRKVPKFDYTTAKRTTIYNIVANQLVFVEQKIEPAQARFLSPLFGDFNLEK